MPQIKLPLLLLPALAGTLACSRAESPKRIAIQGQILGVDGKPMPLAHARIWRDPFKPEVMVQADGEGRFNLKALLKPGVYKLGFSGVGHHYMEANLWVDADRSFEVQANLGTYRMATPLKDLRLEVKDEQGRITAVPMTPQRDGTWLAEAQFSGQNIRTRILHAAEVVPGVPYPFGINGTQGEGFEATADHNYANVIHLKEGRTQVSFDPGRLPQGDPLPHLTFGPQDADLAEAWKVDQECQAIMLRQTLRWANTPEEQQVAFEAIKAFRKAQADRWESALARETRPRVRQALAAALLLFGGNDKAPVLRAFAPGHAFWAQVDETELGIAARHTDAASRKALMGIILDQRSPEAALRMVKQGLLFVRPDKVEEAFAELEALRPGHPVIGKLRLQLKAEQARISPGQAFPDFKLPHLEKPQALHRLDDFRGKYVLVDFWATWCGPCVGDLPGLHQAYERYRRQGLEVLSLSLDRMPGAVSNFRSAGKFPMPWQHAFLEGGTEHPLCKALQVQAIPRMFLLGPDGRILASDESLRGGNLEHTLASVLKAH